MATEIFTKSEFEKALPRNSQNVEVWESTGLQTGEYTYSIRINDSCAISIRSSVRANGHCADTGKDSIRAWLVGNDDKPVGSKVQSYVTRVSGWDARMVDMLRKLYLMGRNVKKCSGCGSVTKIFKVKKDGPNKGRLFTKCDCDGSFRWVKS